VRHFASGDYDFTARYNERMAKLISALHLLRTRALRLPDVEEAIACKGTALESSAFKVGGKSFLFIGAKEMRLKLGTSLAEAGRIEKKDAAACTVGAGGWVKIPCNPEAAIPAATLEKWVEESYRLFAPKSAKPKKKK